MRLSLSSESVVRNSKVYGVPYSSKAHARDMRQMVSKERSTETAVSFRSVLVPFNLADIELLDKRWRSSRLRVVSEGTYGANFHTIRWISAGNLGKHVKEVRGSVLMVAEEVATISRSETSSVGCGMPSISLWSFGVLRSRAGFEALSISSGAGWAAEIEKWGADSVGSIKLIDSRALASCRDRGPEVALDSC